jgi:hypothetical protein
MDKFSGRKGRVLIKHFLPAVSARPLRTTAFISILLLNFLLSLFFTNPVKAADPAPIQLSATSGATGTVVTVKGSVPADFSYLPIISIFVMPNPNANFYMRMGATSVKPDGTLSWTGALPRAGLEFSGDGSENPREVTLPKGPVAIVFGFVPTFESQKAIFTVTDNAAGPYSDPGGSIEIHNNWTRTDSLVQVGGVSRSWLWGPNSYEVIEPYKESPKGWRFVTYFDKARMEITNPAAPSANNPYFVTNGLLVRELVTGQLQLGNTSFEARQPANVPTAGDFTPTNKTPYFSAYTALQNVNDNQDNATITVSLDSQGKVTRVLELEQYGVKATNLVKETNHYIASPFWTFLNSSGPIIVDVNTPDQAQRNGRIFEPLFSATGYPITEPYWTKTVVGGVEKDVLVQLFERRVLTFTPANPAAFQVEMGNVGLQYYQWRYNAGLF